MYINATLLVQAVHFLIAYFLLRFFLYKPIVALIQKKDQDKFALMQNISDKKVIIASKEESLAHYWSQRQQDLLSKKPKIQEIIFTAPPQIQAIEEISQEQLDKLVHQVSELIVNRADHVS